MLVSYSKSLFGQLFYVAGVILTTLIRKLKRRSFIKQSGVIPNIKMANKPIIWDHWIDNGIWSMSDLCNNDGLLKTQNELPSCIIGSK